MATKPHHLQFVEGTCRCVFSKGYSPTPIIFDPPQRVYSKIIELPMPENFTEYSVSLINPIGKTEQEILKESNQHYGKQISNNHKCH